MSSISSKPSGGGLRFLAVRTAGIVATDPRAEVVVGRDQDVLERKVNCKDGLSWSEVHKNAGAKP